MSSLQTATMLKGRSIKRDGFEVRENREIGLLRLQTFGRTPDAVAAVRDQVDLPLPGPGEFSTDSICFYWAGPGQWIVSCPIGEEAAVAARLRKAVEGLLAVVTEITDSRVVLDVAGDRFREVLARGSSVDFHQDTFLDGGCLTTRFAGIPAMIACGVIPGGARIFCDASFGSYLADWFDAASFDL